MIFNNVKVFLEFYWQIHCNRIITLVAGAEFWVSGVIKLPLSLTKQPHSILLLAVVTGLIDTFKADD